MRSILVATDGSVLSGKALAKAIDMAKQFNARLTIVNVLDIRPVGEAFRRFAQVELPGTDAARLAPLPLPLADTYGLASAESLDLLDSQSRGVAQLVSDRILADAKQAAETAGITNVDTVSTSGDPGQSIVATAKAIGADLVVVGRRGLSGLDELVLGSVSHKVLHHSPSDVLIAA